MSNLGWYQWITTTSKKVGEPLKLITIIGSSGALAGGIVGSAITKKISNFKEKKLLKALEIYSVIKDAEIKEINLSLKTGDKITVFGKDQDSILIVKNGDYNNPYFVSTEFLMECSNYV